ncbi:hypothetical protein N7509_014195 [Penicillium cosmopolitanum]|uniref:Alpha/beta hydrolase fold-3 domain-containing protein n=1 Tax=Penicillium cosmopolitanum TaxID=1131564 RepID=A0A9W9S4T1_9EURO|nr:uncharacterized protein N7509_014195 [Penicillium cosmopolitanum]KAJ5369583.1 hypothetical protein N7509_014195 [Penicillium cosmopolitanum]
MSGEALSRPPLDAGIAEILSKLPPMHFPTNSDEISQFHEAVLESLAPATDAILSDPNIQIESSQINGPRGDIPLVILRPKSAISSSDLCPGILFLHGGAMISGNPFNGLNIVSDMITELNAVVISVDYRLAP